MENEKKQSKEDVNRQVNEVLSAESMVLDNKIEFETGDKTYRLRSPEPAEKLRAGKIKDEKYLELLGKPNYMLKSKLIEVYKEKGIDIVKDFDGLFSELQKKIDEKLIKLAEKKDDQKEDIEILKQEIIALRTEQFEITQKKGELLSYSIEDIAFQTYMLQLIVECAEVKEENDKWSKVYTSIADFEQSSNEALNNRFAFLVSKVCFGAEEVL